MNSAERWMSEILLPRRVASERGPQGLECLAMRAVVVRGHNLPRKSFGCPLCSISQAYALTAVKLTEFEEVSNELIDAALRALG